MQSPNLFDLILWLAYGILMGVAILFVMRASDKPMKLLWLTLYGFLFLSLCNQFYKAW